MIVRDIPASNVNFMPTRDWFEKNDYIEVYQCILFAQGDDASAMDAELEHRNASGFRNFASTYGCAFDFDASCYIRDPETYRYMVCDTIKAYREKYKVLATTGDGYIFSIYRVGYVSTTDLAAIKG